LMQRLRSPPIYSLSDRTAEKIDISIGNKTGTRRVLSVLAAGNAAAPNL
jgi:hypothetical protein